jgi:mannose PTS system EIIC component
MTPAEVALLALVGGLFALDRVAVAQFGFGQPLVAGSLTGWALGDPGIGLLLGGALQLLYAGALPIGASVPPDEATAAVVASAAGVVGARLAGGDGFGLPVLPASLLAGLAAGEAGRALDVWVRRANVWFAHRADAAAARGDDRAVALCALGGLGLWFAVGALAALVMGPLAAYMVGWAHQDLSREARTWLFVVGLALVILAFGSGLTAMRTHGRVALFVGAFAAGTLLAAATGAGLRP